MVYSNEKQDRSKAGAEEIRESKERFNHTVLT
jgi:hypothetical protein